MVKSILPIIILLSATLVHAGQGTINGSVFEDPTGPWGAVEASVTSNTKSQVQPPTLQAIFVRDNIHVAIMDDKEVVAGSWISGFRIRQITDNYVYFVRNNKELRLSLFDSKIKH